MALTKASLVDLNSGELILDLDADTSITADTDDTIHFKIGGTDRVTIAGSALSPSSANGSALGTTSLEWSDLFLADGAVISFGVDQDVSLTHVADTGLLLSSTDQLQFGDSGTYIHQSADGVLDLVSDTEIEINATTIDMNGVLNLSGNLVVGSATVTEAQFEILDGATVTTDELNILDGVTATTAEVNLLDGDTSPGTTAITDGDALIVNDGTTMRQTTVQTFATYFGSEITTMSNLVTTGALNSGSITSGFGAIDNGSDNITSGGLVKLDVDADADDVSGDSATGRLTIGAGEDLNFYHGGTNSYIVNDTGDLIIKTGASDEDFIIKGNDGGSEITALTLDMSAAGAATFNSTITATGFVIGSADITEAELEILDGLNTTTAELNIMDGDTSATSTTVVDADRVVMNDNGTMVQVAVTDLAAYFDDEITAMPNLTSVGTLTALTVDDVAVNGKVITMTGSTSDTATLTVGTNGTLDIVTTDDNAAAANIQITADGTAELAGTTVTLDSSGGITLDADGGTITFADAGSSLGTITSSGYSGTAAVATAVTVTDNESTNENNVLTFVAGADADGGNVGLESDGNLTYNPSTGTLTVTNLVTSGTHTVTNSVEMTASSTVVFEGATADAHETTLGTIDATGDRTINLPNVSGTLPVLAAASATQITSTPEELNILDDATVTTAELNLIDGGTARGTTAVASGDGILINDGGTMRMTNVDTVSTYFSSHNVGGGNIVTTGALGTGSIATGFGAIDNGASGITTGGLLSVDADADANDNTADSSTGRIQVGASGDLTLYHNTNSYIVNKTGNLYIHSETDDSDIVFTGEDGSSGITALTLDMSAAGAATFNNDVTAFSDARLKDNVETIPDALDKVNKMRGVTFTRNDAHDAPGTGVIAQEMQEVFPIVVKENDDENNTLSVSYGNLVGVLIESIKELSDKVDTLQEEIQTLKG